MDHHIQLQMDRHVQEEATDKRRGRRALLAFALLCCIGAAASLYAQLFVKESSDSLTDINTHGLSVLHNDESSSPNSDESDERRRRLSIALEDGGCTVTYAEMSEVEIPPTWQASFPGSGSRMTWSLVEALTGIRTNDDYDSHGRGYERVVAVKTHYPIKNARHKFPELDTLFSRAMVILRHPHDAIPSYFNLQYEHWNNLPNHSTRGPNEDWLAYRENPVYGFNIQLAGYEKFVEYWMERYPDRSNLLLLAYEDLTSDELGPSTTKRIADYLRQTEGVEPIADESVPCIWETIVNYKNHPPASPNNGEDVSRARRLTAIHNGEVDPSSLRSGPKIRPYTEEQLQMMIDMFQRLSEKYSHDRQFVRIMSMYTETIENTEPNNMNG